MTTILAQSNSGVPISTIIAIASLGINTVVIIISGVWMVAKIKGSTDLLSQAIEHLRGAVETVTGTVKEIDNRTDNHEVRISKLESR